MASGLKIYWNVERQDSDRYGRIRLYRGREKNSLCRDHSQSDLLNGLNSPANNYSNLPLPLNL